MCGAYRSEATSYIGPSIYLAAAAVSVLFGALLLLLLLFFFSSLLESIFFSSYPNEKEARTPLAVGEKYVFIPCISSAVMAGQHHTACETAHVGSQSTPGSFRAPPPEEMVITYIFPSLSHSLLLSCLTTLLFLRYVSHIPSCPLEAKSI